MKFIIAILIFSVITDKLDERKKIVKTAKKIGQVKQLEVRDNLIS